jgi:hypothetical protein
MGNGRGSGSSGPFAFLLKHWKPYDGPPNWDFMVLAASTKEVPEEGEKHLEVNSG